MYEVLSEIQTQETDLNGDQQDVMQVQFQSPEGYRGVIRVPLSAGWDQSAIGYIQQRVTEMQSVAPALATITAESQTQDVRADGSLADVMQLSFETYPERFVGVVRVPIADGWPQVASDAIDALTTEMQNVAAAGQQ